MSQYSLCFSDWGTISRAGKQFPESYRPYRPYTESRLDLLYAEFLGSLLVYPKIHP
jgi:hypothetical protein